MKLKFLLIGLALFFLSCNSNDDSQPPINNSEYITWTSLGADYNTAEIFKAIDSDSFELSGEEDPYFNIYLETNGITEGDIYTIDTTIQEGYLGYSTGNEEDVSYSTITLEFVEVTDTYIYGEFTGDDANIVDNSTNPHTQTPSNAVITNGKFRINL